MTDEINRGIQAQRDALRGVEVPFFAPNDLQNLFEVSVFDDGDEITTLNCAMLSRGGGNPGNSFQCSVNALFMVLGDEIAAPESYHAMVEIAPYEWQNHGAFTAFRPSALLMNTRWSLMDEWWRSVACSDPLVDCWDNPVTGPKVTDGGVAWFLYDPAESIAEKYQDLPAPSSYETGGVKRGYNDNGYEEVWSAGGHYDTADLEELFALPWWLPGRTGN